MKQSCTFPTKRCRLTLKCIIHSLKKDLEGVCSTLEEKGVLCKAIDFRTKAITFIFTDAFICLAARSRYTMEVQMQMQKQVTLLEQEREANQRKLFVEKFISNVNLHEVIEAEILKRVNANRGFASGIKKGMQEWGGANMKWKTRFIKISNDLKYFQICKHNVNAFDSTRSKYEIVQTCDLLYTNVFNIQKAAYSEYSIAPDTPRYPLKIATNKWSKRDRVYNSPRNIILTLPDPSTAEKVMLLVEAAKHKLLEASTKEMVNQMVDYKSSTFYKGVESDHKHKNPMKQEKKIIKSVFGISKGPRKSAKKRLSILDMEDCIDFTLQNDGSNYSSDTDEANSDDETDVGTALGPPQGLKGSYVIHVNILDVNNLKRNTLYSSTCVSSTPYLYCVAQMEFVNGDTLLHTEHERSLNIGKLIQQHHVQNHCNVLTQ